MRRTLRPIALLPVALLLLALVPTSRAAGQWTHRYPKVAGFAHHVYLEGYELPLLTNGPIDAVPSPDGRLVAFASRGWLWTFDPATGIATQLTDGAGVDSRPAWSPDGKRLAFLRDDTRRFTIVVRELASGAERTVVSDSALVLDPAFSPDGGSLWFSSSVAGDLDLWRLDLASGARTRVTSDRGLELAPHPLADGKRLVYLVKGGSHLESGSHLDEIRVRSLADGKERVLVSGEILSQMRPAPTPDGRAVAYAIPGERGWELRLIGTAHAESSILLRGGRGLPLTPSVSADGRWIWFSEDDAAQHMALHRIATNGGTADEVPVRAWRFARPMARVRIRTTLADGAATSARLHVTDASGHPLVPDDGQVRFDGQNGLAYFYSAGTVELLAPAGEVRATAVRGLATPAASGTVNADGATTREIALQLTPVWDARAHGWFSGDHHFHLNYGGPYRLAPADLLPQMAGEDLDVATPLLANLQLRFEDQPLFADYRHIGELPFIQFGQEVRSHFLGHVSLIAAPQLFWPWVWGPGYEVHGQDDRSNEEPLRWGRRVGAVNVYVHPVMRPNPFGPEMASLIPIGIVPDVVNGDVDAIEVACVWSDEEGTADLWHRFLDLGVPLAPEAGTDVMSNFYRTMAVGATRVYVRAEQPVTMARYLAGLRAGKSFVSNGPLIDFAVEGARPGDVLARGARVVKFTLDLHSAVPVDSVDVLVNGTEAWRAAGLAQPGSHAYAGTVTVPAGGWIAARAHGGTTRAWPAMDSYAFAHTAPIWIARVGSTDPTAERTAARELLAALDANEKRLRDGYAGAEIPTLLETFARARKALEAKAR